ncbi:rod shape-determining protein MreD [uncultured Brevundimonas sp.]|uniref:rod shape-determining protein MreD n=1 Tax=uncultured Brevundimonas sp. TaxID=213418 RepID=UPI00261A6214|nr:rod shape-determining protein MreD [uncultured Brevundimonas sp.]
MRRPISVRMVGPLEWVVYPALMAVLATVVLSIPFRLFGLTLPEPVFPLVLAYAWPMIRPAAIGPIVLFVLGLFLDLYWGGQFGLWALALMIVYGAMLLARAFMSGHATVVNFALYVGCVALAFFVAYVVTALRLNNAPSVMALIGQMLPTLLLFPVADWLVQKFDDNDVRFV